MPAKTACLALLLALAAATAAQDRSDKKAPPRKGTVVGALVAKGPNWLEVKADGEARPRRYFPHWRGGAPAAGGGADKKTLALIRKLKVGSRVRLEWTFEERPRIEKVEVLREPAEKKPPEKKEGAAAGGAAFEVAFLGAAHPVWHTDYAKARAEARRTGKPLFVVFRCQP